jgi:hypothetical protein
VDSALMRYLNPDEVCGNQGSLKSVRLVKDDWVVVPRWRFIENMLFPMLKVEDKEDPIRKYILESITAYEASGYAPLYVEISCDAEIEYTRYPRISGRYEIVLGET